MFRKNLPLSTLIELCSHFITVYFRLKIELDSNIINPRNLFVIVSTWGKKKNTCVHQQWNGYTSMVYLYMKYFKELTMNKVLLHTRSWMNFSDIILSKEFRHKRLQSSQIGQTIEWCWYVRIILQEGIAWERTCGRLQDTVDI